MLTKAKNIYSALIFNLWEVRERKGEIETKGNGFIPFSRELVKKKKKSFREFQFGLSILLSVEKQKSLTIFFFTTTEEFTWTISQIFKTSKFVEDGLGGGGGEGGGVGESLFSQGRELFSTHRANITF